MCGITGVWHFSKQSESPAIHVQKMMEQMVHRGPDSSGVWTSEDSLLSLGHLRLAIQDVSELGHQPMLSKSDRYVIVFNGEIYNFHELLKTLESLGQSFKGHSDTEVMLAAFEAWGIEETISNLEGMFAVALYDKQEECLWLFRDRMGEKPLYLICNEQGIAFASELKAIQELTIDGMELDLDELNRYFRFGYFSQTASPYSQIKKLPAGHLLKLDKNQLNTLDSTYSLLSKSQQYWSNFESAKASKSNNQLATNDDEKYLKEFKKLLTDSVCKQSIADVDLGVFLSGGIDSSLVASALQNNSNTKINTYTIAFDDPKYNEADHARKIAEHLNTNHTEIPLSMEECFESIKLLPKLLDEPFADASILPTYLVTREARKHVTVCLSGDGGDELFAGYNRYISGAKYSRLSKKIPAPLRKLSSKVIQSIPEGFFDGIYSPFASMQRARGNVPEKDIGVKAHKLARLMGSDCATSIYVDLLSFWKSSPLINRDEIDFGYYQNKLDFPIEESFITNAMLHDQKFYLNCDNLFKVDRAAMLNSLEVRLPLLTHPIIEFANNLPLEYKVRHGTSKWLMRELLYQWVPQKLIDRPKMGFSIPLNQWFRNELKSWAESYILDVDKLEAAKINPSVLFKSWQEHQKQVKDHANAIWAVITYLVWFESNQKFIR